MNITYHHEGDYLIPDLVPPESPHIGMWGERRRRFLRTNLRAIYDGMLMDGTLNAHLEEIDRNAEAMFDWLMPQMVEQEGVTEELKVKDQIRWVQAMNSIRNRVEETITRKLIFFE